MFVCFTDLLKAVCCYCLYIYIYIYIDTNKANQTRFSLQVNLCTIISIWNSFGMYFYICYKCITILVTSFNLLSSCRAADEFLWQIVRENEERLLAWIGKRPFNGPITLVQSLKSLHGATVEARSSLKLLLVLSEVLSKSLAWENPKRKSHTLRDLIVKTYFKTLIVDITKSNLKGLFHIFVLKHVKQMYDNFASFSWKSLRQVRGIESLNYVLSLYNFRTLKTWKTQWLFVNKLCDKPPSFISNKMVVLD